MVKAIIVDDEQITRKGLLNYIDWASLGIKVIGEATDGLEGLELAKNTKPDIAICDVRMPKMDGIKLAEHLRELLPQCKIIFLSGYSDKEYLKSAIQIKAVDYVEKPVNLKEFQELLRKTAESCSEDRKKLAYFQSSLLVHLIKDESVDLERVKDGLKHISLQLPLEERYICVVFKSLNNLYEQELAEEISTEFAKENIRCLSGIEQNELVVIAAIQSEAKVEIVKALCTKIIARISDKAKISIAAGIGDLAEGIDMVVNSYQHAKEVLKSITLKTKNQVAVFDNNRDKSIIRSIENYIQNNYRTNLTINTIASAVYLTPQYLCVLYKKETGKTVNDYLTEIRMEAAKELLKDPTIKLYEVADKVGYNDPNYFAKVFKKVVGYKPSEYRDRN